MTLSQFQPVLSVAVWRRSVPSLGIHLDLDEDDAKASFVYNNRVVAISLDPVFKIVFFIFIFASHSFFASGTSFPFVSRIVVNVSAPHVCSKFG